MHGGGRFALDGWPSSRLRLHLEYDLSTTLDHAPEINGWKALRILRGGQLLTRRTIIVLAAIGAALDRVGPARAAAA